MAYLPSAVPFRSPEGLCLSHRLQVAQSSVSVGVVPWELGTACAYGQGKGGGWVAVGEQCSRCLGDQILSQEAGVLAQQSPGAQDWVPGRVEEVDGAGGWVRAVGYPPTQSPPQGTLKKF